MKNERTSYTGWSAFVDQVQRPWADGCPDISSVRERPSKDWDLHAGFDGALKLAKSGWADGFKKVELKAKQIAELAEAGNEMRPCMAEAGDEVDVGLFLAGEPECMIEYPIEPKKNPVKRVIVSAAFSAGVPADDIYNRGAAICAAVDLLESSGIRTEIILDISLSDSGVVYRHSLPLKQASEALDRDKVIFAVCHPAMLRRLMFRIIEQMPPDKFPMCYGMPVNPEPQEGAIVFGALIYGNKDYSTIESAAADVRGRLGI